MYNYISIYESIETNTKAQQNTNRVRIDKFQQNTNRVPTEYRSNGAPALLLVLCWCSVGTLLVLCWCSVATVGILLVFCWYSVGIWVGIWAVWVVVGGCGWLWVVGGVDGG